MTVRNATMEQELGRIHCQDCIRGMQALPEGSIDLVFADPPFNIGYEYDVYDDRRAGDEYLGWSADWMQSVWRVLRDDGTFWLAIGDEFAAELKVAATQIGFHTRSWVIWYYTFGVNCKNKFTRSHTHLLYFVKDPREFTFLSDEPDNRVPSARQLVYNDQRASSKGRLPDDTWIIPPDVEQTFILRPQDLQEQFQPEEDTWYFPRVAGTFKERARFHGCQMPEQLLGRIIRSCSRQDDIVMDPFSGSASTLIVAKKLHRQFVGFELSEEYVKAGMDRLEAIEPGAELTGAPEPTMSAKPTPGRVQQNDPNPAATLIARDANEESVSAQKPTSVAASDVPLARRLSSVIDETVTAAFMEAHDGYAVDRVLADPELQAAFYEECARLRLPMSQKEACLRLLKLRKRGGTLRGTKRFTVSVEDCDRYLFASEIAWCLTRGDDPDTSLEGILADPERAAEFDELAQQFAPGYSSLEYRWAALRLRKSLKVTREKAHDLKAPRRLWLETRFAKLQPYDVAEDSGVFLVSDAEECLYAGGTLGLRSRLQQITEKPSRHWGKTRQHLRVQYFVVPAHDFDALAWTSRMIAAQDSAPRFNLPELHADFQ